MSWRATLIVRVSPHPLQRALATAFNFLHADAEVCCDLLVSPIEMELKKNDLRPIFIMYLKGSENTLSGGSIDIFGRARGGDSVNVNPFPAGCSAAAHERGLRPCVIDQDLVHGSLQLPQKGVVRLDLGARVRRSKEGRLEETRRLD